jgi:CheY-like chemotaxis protein
MTQGLSTIMGLFLPYCRNAVEWWTIMIISCILYLFMFPALFKKRRTFLAMDPGTNAYTKELWNRTRLSYRLMQTCTFAWTALVVMFCIAGAAIYFTPKDTNPDGLWLIQRPYFTMLWEATMDVILKNLYMNIIIQVHKAAFDDGERDLRRVQELRQILNGVWENSSDVVCISALGNSGTISTMVSPVYRRLFQNITERPKSIVFEMKIDDSSPVKAKIVQDFNYQAFERPESNSNQQNHSLSDIVENVHLTTDNEAIDDSLLSSLAGMVASAWNSKEPQTSLTHSLLKDSNGEKVPTPCEANIRWLGRDAMFMLIRDISEQSKRFEAERTMIMQTTARKKDAEANRFTRHEVKNGLLVAIHLCESMAGTEESSGDQAESNVTLQHMDSRSRIAAHAIELDKELRSILHTVLSDAMARDLIHGIYEPKLGRVDIEKLLPNSERFRLIASPSPFPLIYSDPQLLSYIHRNAMSNACKYGQFEGVVTTRLHYDESKEMLLMDVENLPGLEHDRLLRLGPQANEAVFEPGKRLHHEEAGENLNQTRIHSSGDGAWIIRKCAETLKGNANIVFGTHQTTLSFTCPTTLYENAGKKSQIFQTPSNTWGLVMDDSKIQRKLLSNLLEKAGVVESRQIVRGSTAAEILAFDSYLVELVRQNPSDYFLVIVDENLDITQNGTRRIISGSECIQRVRQQLLPGQERQMLALVRSANDSTEDVATYNSRAHGHISKGASTPLSSVETIAFFWEQRFKGNATSETITSSSDESYDDFASIVVEELMARMDAVDGLYSQDSVASMEQNWPRVWEIMHSLKGDLSSLIESPQIDQTVTEINNMRGVKLPVNFESRWKVLRSRISDIAKAIGNSALMEIDERSGRGKKRPNPGGTLLGNSGNDGTTKKPRA